MNFATGVPGVGFKYHGCCVTRGMSGTQEMVLVEKHPSAFSIRKLDMIH